MKQIFRVMSDMVVPGIAALAGMSLLPRLGQHMDVPRENYSGYGDTAQAKIACGRKPPQIVRKGSGNCRQR